MTLDEARDLLGVGRGADRSHLNRAFQRRARQLHPDMHPNADGDTRRRLAFEFDQLRRARDILLLLADSPSAESTTRESEGARAGWRGHQPEPSRVQSPSRSEPGTPPSGQSRAQRTTLRFDEFVARQDAAGFGPGTRSRPPRDLARIVAWAVVAAAVLTTAAALTYAAIGL